MSVRWDTNCVVTDSSIIATKTGFHFVSMSLNLITHSANNTNVHICAFIDDVEETSLETERKVATGGDIGSMSSSGYIYLTAGQVVKFKAKADNTGTITIGHSNLTVKYDN
jgi:hypothetical protein